MSEGSAILDDYYEPRESSGSGGGGIKALRDGVGGCLSRFKIKLIMNILSILFGLCIAIVVVWGWLFGSINPLKVIVTIYLLIGMVLMVCTSIPWQKIRQYFLFWFFFLSTYNGKGLFIFFLGLLATGINTPGIIVGIALMLLGLAHCILWLFFRDYVKESKVWILTRQDNQREARDAAAVDANFTSHLSPEMPPPQVYSYNQPAPEPYGHGGDEYTNLEEGNYAQDNYDDYQDGSYQDGSYQDYQPSQWDGDGED
eukprot:CAMPEP_0174253220 /NCGR_PEP_ID=MMETSP0439-20130205/2599_1 /TAXON_ID=0 /ORGANISM="Stereomyxa ramosa, Strain Chinc5" /LENGTH=255 /DNA_ID=CAMNT_0015334129 /DNA_START=58 /DNA_END=825 /DNA_ORIENTATION=-